MSTEAEATNLGADDADLSVNDQIQEVAEGEGAQGEDTDDQIDAAGDGQAEEEVEEYELEGKTYKLPKSVIPHVMKNADYTQKTQRLSEERRSLEQKAQAIAQQEQATTELMEERVKVGMLRQQVEAYKAVDWDALEAQDETEARRHWRSFERLKDQLGEAEQGLKSKESERLQGQQQQAVAAFQETMRGLMDPVEGIPGFTVEKVNKIEALVKEFGLTSEDLVTTTDRRAWRVLNTLYDVMAENKALKAKQRHTASQQTKPATQIRGQGGKFSVAPDTDDFAAFEKQYG